MFRRIKLHQTQSSAINGLVVALAGTAACLALCGALASRLLAAWASRGPLLPARPSGAAVAQLVELPLLALGVAFAAWWALSLGLVATTLLAGAAGARTARLARCVALVAPRAVQRLAVAGLGAGLVLAVTPAHASQAPPDLGWVTTPATAPATPVPLGPGTDPSGPADAPTAPVPSASTSPAPTVPVAAPTTAPTSAAGTVTVAPGDSLWSIAHDHLGSSATDDDVAAAWPTWYAANAEVVGDDPDLIHVGQVLAVPHTDR